MDTTKINSRSYFCKKTSLKPLINLILLLFFFCSACSQLDIKREINIPEQFKTTKSEIPQEELKLPVPDFEPVIEDISPFKTKIIDLIARNTPLRNVLHVITDATGLNLTTDRGVDLDMPINIALKSVSVADALEALFNTVDYFYEITNNMLVVKHTDTRIFEIGHPPVVTSYDVSLGGDILGASTSSFGASASSSIKGNVTQSIKTDAAATNFWDAFERSIAMILGQTPPTPQQPTQAQPTGLTPTAQTSQPQQPTSPMQPPITATTPIAPTPTMPQATATPFTAALPAGPLTTPTTSSYSVNRITGTLFVTATKEQMKKVETYINHIKKVMRRQILIEAKIIEVSLSDDLRYGIDWDLISKRIKGFDLKFKSVNITEVIPSNAGLPAYTVSLAQLSSGANAVLKALQQQGEVRTLSNPRLNILNGQTALLSVGRNMAYISRVDTSVTEGNPPRTNYSIATNSVLSGLIIGIVPYINEHGEISLTITPVVSELVRMDDKTVGGNVINLPTVDLRELSTTVKVRDNQMIIIGGLITQKEHLDEGKVPFLGDAPLVGELFKSKKRIQARSELVVLLSTHLITR